MKFSVLMSLYYKETVEHLDDCLNSILGQSMQPAEVIVVEDGPLTQELYNSLESWTKKIPLVRVQLPENVGLGKALNEGLRYCSYETVARMDTDDICHPSRFEKQVYMLSSKDIDICGSWVCEFEDSRDIITSYRRTPETHSEIVATSKFRNPLNHPAVMYRKSAVLDVGGYDSVLYFEDYHLWLKLILKGYKFYNIQEALVSMRAGNAQLSRRGGLNYARLEFAFLRRSSREGIMPKRYAVRNTLIRFPLRIMPTKALGKIYRIIRSNEV